MGAGLCGAYFLALYYWRKWGNCSLSSKQLFCSLRYLVAVQHPSAPADGTAPIFFLLDVLPKVHCTWLSILFFMPLEMPLALACFYKPLHLRQQAPHKKPDDSCLVIKDNHQNQCRRRDHRWSAEKPTTSIYGRGHYNRWPWLQHGAGLHCSSSRGNTRIIAFKSF